MEKGPSRLPPGTLAVWGVLALVRGWPHMPFGDGDGATNQSEVFPFSLGTWKLPCDSRTAVHEVPAAFLPIHFTPNFIFEASLSFHRSLPFSLSRGLASRSIFVSPAPDSSLFTLAVLWDDQFTRNPASPSSRPFRRHS